MEPEPLTDFDLGSGETTFDIIEMMKYIDYRMGNLLTNTNTAPVIIIHPRYVKMWYKVIFHYLPPLIKAKIRLAMTCAVLGTRKWID